VAHPRTDGDDLAAAPGFQMGDGGLGAEVGPRQIDIQSPFPIIRIALLHAAPVQIHPRIDGEDVQSAQLPGDRFGHALHRRPVGHVRGDGDGLPALRPDFGDDGLDLGFRARCAADGCAGAGIGQGNRSSNAPPRAGDQRDLARQGFVGHGRFSSGSKDGYGWVGFSRLKLP